MVKSIIMSDKINIPKPCHEDWNNMSQEAQGRHCMVCSKTVIDFTSWDEQQILDYLQNKNQERVCGRFNVSQLETTQEHENIFPVIMKSNISILKKIAAIVLLCFGVMSSAQSSGQEKIGKVKCVEQPVVGNPAIIYADSTKQVHTDTTAYKPQIMGMVKPYQPHRKTKINKKQTPKQ